MFLDDWIRKAYVKRWAKKETGSPGYNWMAQAVSDLSAETAPSRMLWNQLAALYGKCSLVNATCVSVFISDKKISTKLLRIGIYFVPPQYFGVVERFSVFAAVGFNAVLGVYLFEGFGESMTRFVSWM